MEAESTPIPLAVLAPGAPKAEDINCPLCDYNLRGLAEPRCPECGYQFQWADLTDPARRKHRYLFEHHLTIRSYFRTVVGALRPLHFWRSLHPSQTVFLARLRLYWFIGILFMLPTACITAGVFVWQMARWNQFARSLAPPYLRANPARLDDIYPVSFSWRLFERAYEDFTSRVPWQAAIISVLIILWPAMTTLALSALRASMKRAKIQPPQVLRCVVYCFDLPVWLFIASIPLAAWIMLLGPLQWRVIDAAASLLPFVGAIAYLWFMVRLAAAYRIYLQFDHPTAVVIASQIILILLVLVIAVQFPILIGL